MRSAVLAALVLAGCKPAEHAPAEPSATPAAEIAATVPAPPPAGLPHLFALGTEPFWGVEVLADALRYTTPGNAPVDIAAKRTFKGKVQVRTGSFQGSPFELRIAPGTCSDGMSDTAYGYTAVLKVSGQTLQGCAQSK